MKKLRIVLILGCLLMFGLQLQAQYKITGKVVDQKNNPQAFANIALYTLDHQLVGGVASAAEGGFVLPVKNHEKYKLVVSLMGYEKKEIDNISISKENTDLGLIHLNESTELLSEVNVKGRRKIIETSPGMQAINVTPELVSMGGNMGTILKQIPSVEVSPKGTLKIRGSGNVLILINGRKSVLTLNPQNLLKMIPVASIERIEVITSPSPKYDSEGVDAIINVIFKRGRMDCFNSSIGGYVDVAGLGSGVMSTFKKGKWDVSGILGYYKSKLPYKIRSVRQDLNNAGRDLFTSAKGDFKMNSSYFSLTTNYEIAPKENLTLEATHSKYDSKSDEKSKNTTKLHKDRLIHAIEDHDFSGSDISLTYEKEYSLGRRLDINLNVSDGSLDSKLKIFETIDDLDINTHNPSNADYQMGQLKLDYQDSLFSKVGIESGLSANGLKFKVDQDNQRFFNKSKYDFLQQQYNAYWIGKVSLGKVMLGAGGRFEVFHSNGKEKLKNVKINQRYFKVLPNVMCQYNFREGLPAHSISLIYNQKFNRPQYEQLNPTLQVQDPFNVLKGNTNLKPERVNNMELFHEIRTAEHSITTTLFGRSTHDVIQRVYEIQDKVITTSFENYSNSHSAGIDSRYMLKAFDQIDFSVGFLGMRKWFPKSKDNKLKVNRSGYNWNVKSELKIRTGKGPVMDFKYAYYGKNTEAYSARKAYSKFDMHLSQSFFQGFMTVGLNAEDLFKTAQEEIWVTTIDNLKTRQTWKTLNRNFSLSVYMNF
ncbi:TonB-dependent receptor [Puteibacter caeruleilacunae]|nr:TonB-dependent receptor [Puteibacter caeruleilacunae]